MVVQSLAISVINYCLPIYGSTNITQLHRVQKLQNFAAKVCVGGAKKSDHATPLISELQWLKVKDKFAFDTAVKVFKIKNGVFPDWLLNLPTISEAQHNLNTRQQHKLYIPHTNTDSGQRAFTVLGPKIWNSLPSDITNTHSLHTFMKKLKALLIKIPASLLHEIPVNI